MHTFGVEAGHAAGLDSEPVEKAPVWTSSRETTHSQEMENIPQFLTILSLNCSLSLKKEEGEGGKICFSNLNHQ